MYSSNIKVDWVDENPNQLTKVKKQIWNDSTQTFDPRIFLRVKCTAKVLERDTKWMKEQFGEPAYQGAWWVSNDNGRTAELWMADSLATFWTLKNKSE